MVKRLNPRPQTPAKPTRSKFEVWLEHASVTYFRSEPKSSVYMTPDSWKFGVTPKSPVGYVGRQAVAELPSSGKMK